MKLKIRQICALISTIKQGLEYKIKTIFVTF